MKRFAVVAVFLLIAGLVWWRFSEMASPPQTPDGQTPIVTGLVAADLNSVETAGKAAFDENCAKCHGINAAGNDGYGPPLVHVIYEPNHHGDGAFVLAARQGVRAHHWQFGNMPPVEGITDMEIASIIAYVRAMQRANGIN